MKKKSINPGTNLTKDSQIYLQSKGNQSGTTRSSQWYLQTDSDSIYGNSAFRIAKKYDGGSTNEYLRITSSGNVGIGVTDPSVELEVGGSTNTQILISATNTTGNSQLYFGDSASDTAGVILYRHDGDSMAFEVNDSERMRITSTGNVGIGTTSPDFKLHLAHSDSNNGLLLEHTSQASSYSILQNIRQNEGLIWQRWINGAFNSNLMTLSYDGNVGIGTTSPDQKLHVSGNAKVTGVFYTDYVQTLSGTSIDFRHQDASVVMRVDTANARVGIGTTSPSSKLEVSSSTLTELKVTESGSSVTTMVQSSTSYGWIGTKTNHTMYIGANDGAKMTVLTSGNVGIGTTSPAQKLDVNGSINIGSGIIYIGPWRLLVAERVLRAAQGVGGLAPNRHCSPLPE